MLIHNYFNDVLASVRTLFNTYMFPVSNYIKKYEFNIGNRNIQLGKDYTTQYAFPTLLATLGTTSSVFGGIRPEVIRRMRADNINQIPVLYNNTNGQLLLVQEEEVQLPIDITINCESVLQAMEVEYNIKYFLPQDKVVQIFSFTSFLEINDVFLQENNFDPLTDDILNIFEKPQKSLNKPDQTTEVFCFGLSFYPFIRLDSISTSIQDSSQRSFPVNLTLTYTLQAPMYIFNEKNFDNKIERINIKYDRFHFEPIIEYPMRKVLSSPAYEDNKYVKRNVLYYADNDNYVTIENGVVTFRNQFSPSRFVLEDGFTYYLYDINGNIHREFTPSEVDLPGNRVTWTFTEAIWNQYFDFSQANPIILQIWYTRS